MNDIFIQIQRVANGYILCIGERKVYEDRGVQYIAKNKTEINEVIKEAIKEHVK